jgi:hypothetical protein
MKETRGQKSHATVSLRLYVTELIVHLGPVLGAPDVGGAEPEHLTRRVVEAGQRQLGGLPCRPGVVGAVRLLDPAVVRYVFPL